MQVEQEAVFAALRQLVQMPADLAQQRVVPADLAQLECGHQPVLMQLRPGTAITGRLRHPGHGLQVAQAPGRLLAIGFQGIGGMAEAGMAQPHLQQLGPIEGIGMHGGITGLAQLLVERITSSDSAPFHQGGLHGGVAGGCLQALRHRAHARPGLQPHVPARTHESSRLFCQGIITTIRQQHQYIDVRVREEFLAAKSAYSHQRQRPFVQTMCAPQLQQQFVGQQRQFPQKRRHPFGRAPRGAVQQRLPVVLITLAQDIQVCRCVHMEVNVDQVATAVTNAGGGGVSGESVRTS